MLHSPYLSSFATKEAKRKPHFNTQPPRGLPTRCFLHWGSILSYEVYDQLVGLWCEQGAVPPIRFRCAASKGDRGNLTGPDTRYSQPMAPRVSLASFLRSSMPWGACLVSPAFRPCLALRMRRNANLVFPTPPSRAPHSARPYLFDGTLREQIAYPARELDMRVDPFLLPRCWKCRALLRPWSYQPQTRTKCKRSTKPGQLTLGVSFLNSCHLAALHIKPQYQH